MLAFAATRVPDFTMKANAQLEPPVVARRSAVASAIYAVALLTGVVVIARLPAWLFAAGRPWWTVWLTSEDGPYEAYGALACCAAALVLFRAFAQWPSATSRLGRWLALLLGLALLLMFLEEISWGQRLFAIATPDWLERLNLQQEMNLHNLKIFHPKLEDNRLKRLWVLVSIGYLGLLPLAALVPALRRALDRVGLPVASWQVAVAALAAYTLYKRAIPPLVAAGDLYAAHDSGEAIETTLELAYLALALETWRKVGAGSLLALRGWRWPAVVAAFAALLLTISWGVAKPVAQGSPQIAAVAWLRVGDRDLAAGHPTAALGAYQKSVDIWPDQPRVHFKAAEILLARNQPQPAEVHLRAALQLAPESAAYHDKLGFALRGQRRVDEAAAAFAKAVELDPAIPEYHNNLGVGRADQGDIPAAIKCFEQALRLRPDYPDARQNLAVLRRQPSL